MLQFLHIVKIVPKKNKMNKQEAEKKNISIHWWNFGSKTLDFKGTYKDYLRKRNIKVRTIKHPFAKDTKGYRFTIPLSGCVARLDIFGSDYAANCDEAIKVFLTLLGDKALFNTGYGRELKLNWR